MSTLTKAAKIIIALTTISAAIMELIDTSIVNVALNQMAGNLGASIEDIAWVITSYAIANVIIIPMTGFLAAYFGRRRCLFPPRPLPPLGRHGHSRALLARCRRAGTEPAPSPC